MLGEDVTAAGIGAELLAKLELLVVLAMLPGATTAAAHVVLPGASFAEKSGTLINAKGRVQQIAPAVAAPGAARAEWQILSELLQGLENANACFSKHWKSVRGDGGGNACPEGLDVGKHRCAGPRFMIRDFRFMIYGRQLTTND